MSKRRQANTDDDANYPTVECVSRHTPLLSIKIQTSRNSKLIIRASTDDTDGIVVAVSGYMAAGVIALDKTTARELHVLLGRMLTELD